MTQNEGEALNRCTNARELRAENRGRARDLAGGGVGEGVIKRP